MPTLSPTYEKVEYQGNLPVCDNDNLFSIYADILTDTIINKTYSGKSNYPNFYNSKKNKSWTAAQNNEKYKYELPDILKCLKTSYKIPTDFRNSIKERIKQNMLYHGVLFRKIKIDCSLQRLRALDNIRAYSRTIIPLTQTVNNEGKKYLF